MVPHSTDIGKAGNNPDSIGYAFPFRCGRRTGIGKTDDAAAQVQHGGFKAKPCPCAGLVKTGGQLLAFAGFGILWHILFNVIGQVKKLIQFLYRKIKRAH